MGKWMKVLIQSSKWKFVLTGPNQILELFYICIYIYISKYCTCIYIYLNKNWKIYSFEQTFTGLGSEDHREDCLSESTEQLITAKICECSRRNLVLIRNHKIPIIFVYQKCKKIYHGIKVFIGSTGEMLKYLLRNLISNPQFK